MFPCILYFFIHPQPNNIGRSRQQPRDWGSLNSSESSWGRGHSCVTTRLHGICNGSIDEWKMGGGHTFQPHSLETGDKCPPKTHPKFPIFCFGLGGGTKVFYPPRPGDLKSHHLDARVTLTAVSVPPRPHFLSTELLCHISNFS